MSHRSAAPRPARTARPPARGKGRARMVKLGTNLPEHLIGTDQGALAEFLGAL